MKRPYFIKTVGGVAAAKKFNPITNDEMKELHEYARSCESMFLPKQKKGLMVRLK